jgi:serine/threonine protein kinase
MDVSAPQAAIATVHLNAPPPASGTSQRADPVLTALREATLGHYEVLTELGRGGMATVYLAHDIALGRKVAIKVMSPSLFSGEGMAERFKREARTAAQLSHPHIIPIYSVQESGELQYFVMKFIEGRPLDSIIKEVGPLPIPMVRTILMQVESALGYAHRRKVIHRDIKPPNIMLDADGWAIVTDFGIAKVSETQGLTVTGATIGTPSYMSPEQCAAQELTGATDQYSLGVVAYEMLTGKLPFIADSVMAVMYAHFNEPPPPVQDVRHDCPAELAATVMRMLEKSPANRFPNMEAASAAMGSVSLAPDDPIRTQMMTLAAAGDNLKLLERFSTPVSPAPMSYSSATTARRSSLAVLTITPGRVTVAAGDAVQLRAVPKKRDGQTLPGHAASWASTNTDVAVVSPTGLVTALAPGTVTITASSADTSATATITVVAPVRSGRGRTIGLVAGGVVAVLVAVGLWLFQPWRTAEQPSSGAGGDTIATAPAVGTTDTTTLATPPEPAPATVETTAAPGAAPPPDRDRPRPPRDSSEASVALALADALAARNRAVSAGAQPSDLAAGDADLQQARGFRQPGHRTDAFALLRAAAQSFAGAEAAAIRLAAQHRPAPVDTTPKVQPPPSPPPAQPADPAPLIREVIAAYGRALESRDVSALRRVYPQITGTQAQAWQDLFDNARNIQADLRASQIDVNGDQAEVAVSGTLTYQNTNTRRQERNPTTFRARLARSGGAWVITAIQ